MPVMIREDADSLIRQALQSVEETHLELFDLDASERALTHHLAVAVEALVPAPLRVDIEYHRHGVDIKLLTLPDRVTLEGPDMPTRVIPDLVVHERGADESNLIVLEVKKNSGSIEFDRFKLRAFKRELGYAHAGHVVFRSGHGRERWQLTWEDG